MANFFLVDNKNDLPPKLASYLGGPARIIFSGTAFDICQRFLDISGGTVLARMRWSLYALSDPDKEKLARLAGEVAEALKSESGEHKITLGSFSLAEVFTVARQKNLDVELVAIFKPRRKEAPGDDPLDTRLLEAIKFFGGRASSGQLCAHTNVIAYRVRRRLVSLQQKGLISKEGHFYVLSALLGGEESAKEDGKQLCLDSLGTSR